MGSSFSNIQPLSDGTVMGPRSAACGIPLKAMRGHHKKPSQGEVTTQHLSEHWVLAMVTLHHHALCYSGLSDSLYFSLLFIFAYFVYECLPVYMHVYHLSAWCLRRSEEVIRSPRTGVTSDCEAPCECWKLNLQDLQVLLTPEPFLCALFFLKVGQG